MMNVQSDLETVLGVFYFTPEVRQRVVMAFDEIQIVPDLQNEAINLYKEALKFAEKRDSVIDSDRRQAALYSTLCVESRCQAEKILSLSDHMPSSQEIRRDATRYSLFR